MNFLKIVRSSRDSFLSYEIKDVAPDLWWLELTIREAYPSRLLSLLNDENSQGVDYEFISISWPGKHKVVFEIIEEYKVDFKDCATYEMSFDHFYYLAKSWFRFFQKKVPKIYFVQKDDDSIVVQETLEGC